MTRHRTLLTAAAAPQAALVAALAAALLGCGSGTFHPCGSDRDCPAPQTCAGGLCVASGCGVGAPTCADDTACQQGQHCAAGCCVFGPSGSCSRDADCSSRPETPVCDVAGGLCVACLAARDCGPGRSCNSHVCTGTAGCYVSADCKDPQKPVCNPQSRACVQCLQASDCPDPQKPDCDVNRTCVGAARCSSDKDCTDGANPHCAKDGQCVPCLTSDQCTGGLVCSAQHQCVPPSATTCVSDAECVSNPALPHCLPGTATTPGRCVACVSDDQCPAGDFCDLDNSCKIKQCNADADCASLPATPKCLTTASPRVCVACLGNADCSTGSTCQPDHSCQAPAPKCKKDDDCAANISAPHCKLGATPSDNACVQCRDTGECGAGVTCPNDCGPGQACNPNNTCVLVACQVDQDCTDSKKPHCLPGSGGAGGTCVQCATPAQCDPGFKCASNACLPVCTQATAATDCAPPTPRCKESPSGNSCVQCLLPADCPAATPVCSANNTCIPATVPGCASNADCPAGQHVCVLSKTPHLCVQCLQNSDCSNGDLCDTTSDTCRPPPVGGEGQACRADQTCNPGLLCVDQGGQAPVCATLCDPNAAANPCAGVNPAYVCEWLGFDLNRALFGICLGKNGHATVGQACDPGKVDSCEWNLLCAPGSATAGTCAALCQPGSTCASGTCNPIVGALDGSGAPELMGWCGPTSRWGQACITDTASGGPNCGDPLGLAGAGGLFCSPSTLPAEVPAANVIALCQYTPAAATANGGANSDCSALGGNACRSGLCLADGPASCFSGCQYNADCTRDGGQYCFDVSLFSGTARGTVGSCEPGCRDNADCRSTAACAPQPNHGGNSWQAVCAPLSGAGKPGATCTGAADCQSGVCVTGSTLQSIAVGQAATGFTATDGFCLGSCLPSVPADCAGAGTTCRIDVGLPLSPRDTGDKGVSGRPNPGVCWGSDCATDANCAGFSADAAAPRVCAPYKKTTLASVDGKKCTSDAGCTNADPALAVCNTPANNPDEAGVYGGAAGVYGPNGRCRGTTWAQHCAPSLGASKGGPGAACSNGTDCKTGRCIALGAQRYCFGGCASQADCAAGTTCRTGSYLGLPGTHCAP